jgi:hypothetical protein
LSVAGDSGNGVSARHDYAERELPAFVAVPSGCWIWLAWAGRGGYGRWTKRGPDRKRHAHVVVWETFNGPVPDGYELDHLCRVRPCVNPAHLDPVPKLINLHRRNLANGWRRRAGGGRGSGRSSGDRRSFT